MVALYIHIPYCKRLCPYCGFYKLVTQADTFDRFCGALDSEIAAYSRIERPIAIETIYVGGGTPSELPVSVWPQLKTSIQNGFDLTALREFTVEMNPESVSVEYLEALKAVGVNRISLGVQSMRIEELKFLGRHHTPEQVQFAAAEIQKSGIENWSADLIYALPESSCASVVYSIEQLIQLSPTHLSVYELTIEPNTRFDRFRIRAAPNESQIEQYVAIQKGLNRAGYRQYEFSAFAKPGFESQHNQVYWECQPYIGIGPGAHSFFRNHRYSNQVAFPKYLEGFQPDIPVTIASDMDPLIEDMVAVQLRLVRGIDLNQAQLQFGVSIMQRYHRPIQRMIMDGFLSHEGQYLKVTPKGWLLIDQIVHDILV